ncbi:hypothetical protein NC653_006029 [Populus alba x Populus x berolinensis]|uniref:Uncharacterized protein n=1 Tax=Populus alba x Populus x berolinensis TaxID=444605 RepID=A0AAD6WBN0_9ROSI|nr:hypothetical protein NC653_006029 [Populus alba x Populus x berolinensis]
MVEKFLDEGYSLSKSLSSKQIVQLALRGCQRNAVDVILTASDVAIEGIFSEPLCPGQCAWPFCQPIYGPQSPRLVAPNSDVGLDAFQNISAISLASNPVFHSRMKHLQIDYHFVRERVITDDLLVQHVSSTDISSPKAVLGFMAKDPIQVVLLVESATGASYKAHGVNGRKYLLPAINRQRHSFRCRFWIWQQRSFAVDAEIGSDAVFAADAEIGSDAVSAANSGFGSDADFAADSEFGSDADFAADAEIGSDAVFAADAEFGSDAVFAADFSISSDAELGGRGKTGFR